MRDLRICDDIRHVLGEQRSAAFAAGPYPAVFHCRTCGADGAVDEHGPVVAGLDVYTTGQARLWLQHAACGPGGIRQVDRPYAEPVGPVDAFGIAFARHGPDGPWPALLVETPYTVIDHFDAETADRTPQRMAQLGMLPVGRVDVEPPPPGEVRWRVDTRRGRVVARVDGEQLVLLAPLPRLPPLWRQVVEMYGGRVALYVASQLGMPAVAAAEDGFYAAVDAAAADGRVVGTTAVLV